MSTPKLFQPIKVGRLTLQSRIVMSPMTRFKGTKKEHVPVVPLMQPYYTQRASHPGTLLITEGVFISPKAGGYDYIPGIWSQDQINAWKEITDSVHKQGAYIYCQIAALGRTAHVHNLEAEYLPLVAPSPIPLKGSNDIPRELTFSEIKEYVEDFAQAGRNAVAAGFDGVELHFANGYLGDQFLQENSNQRTDAYGGSIENRSRFPLEVVKAVSEAIGEDRTAVRISPWSTFQDMRMQDPIPQFSHFIRSLKKAHPNFAYLHVIEGLEGDRLAPAPSGNDFLRDNWSPKPFVSAGGYTRETAIDRADKYDNNLVAFGRAFLANPDLVSRLKNNSPLNAHDESTFYVFSDVTNTEVGYTDYPFLNEKKSPQVDTTDSPSLKKVPAF